MDKNKLYLIRKARESLEGSLRSCAICPRMCRIDRKNKKTGYCRAGLNASVYSYIGHHGEEPPISGSRGSGTIFFSHCNMKCVYCQNYQFSQLDEGEEATPEKLAKMINSLQDSGSHNINLVNPTHYVPQILAALELAVKNGLKIPIVYNTSGYELADTLKLLEGIVDIYLPDMRYSDDDAARKYSDAVDYVDRNRVAVKEMNRQAGTLILDENGIAVKGLIIRLLVLPGEVSGTKKTMEFIRDNICKDTYLSIMSQYHPTFKAGVFKEISRSITPDEYSNVVDAAHLLGLNNGWIQDAPEEFDPRFLGTNIPPKC